MTLKNKKLLIIISVFVGAAVLGVATSLLLLKPWADKKPEKEEQVEASETEEAHEETGTYEQVDSEETEDIPKESEDANKEAEDASSDAEDTWSDAGDVEASEEGSAGYNSSDKEQMYWDVSDMFGDITVFDGGMSLGVSKYEGDPDGCFLFWGDQYASYRGIIDFRDNTAILGSSTLRRVTPWMVEYICEHDNDDYRMLSGHIEEIDNAMKTQDVPEFIFPDSDHVKIDVYSNYMTYDVVRLAKNEIYARHGRKFKDAQLQAYFDARSWYNGTIEPDKFKEDVLNATEKENVLNFSEWEHYLKDEGLVN